METHSAQGPPLDAAELAERLEALVYMVLSVRRSVKGAAAELARFPRPAQERFLRALELVRTTSDELAFNFCMFAPPALARLEAEEWDEWVLHVMGRYDEGGVLAAIVEMQRIEDYVRYQRDARAGVHLHEVEGLLGRFVQGLEGRELRIAADDAPWTDTETLHLPPVISRMPDREANFALYKAMAVHLWAQTWFGTWRAPLDEVAEDWPDPARAIERLHHLERLRLDACVRRVLPGMARTLAAFGGDGDGLAAAGPPWPEAAAALARPGATLDDSLRWLPAAYEAEAVPPAAPYQGVLRPERVRAVQEARRLRERGALAKALAALAAELEPARGALPGGRFERLAVPDPARPEGFRVELALRGEAVAPSPEVRALLDSIQQDLGDVPPEYLVPAGPGPCRARAGAARGGERPRAEPEAWVYDEWDHTRGTYRRGWCLLREREIHPGDAAFVRETLERHRGLVKHIHRTFEALRGEDRRLRRQPEGEDVDIDAAVQAWADRAAGLEEERGLFVRRLRCERDVAVMLLVDMSGSTKGWISDTEREAVVLLCEALERLGDRYAIYGFSGFTHKRCELYRIKALEEPYGPAVHARIAGIGPRDYTRLGAAVRHLTWRLGQVEARTRVLLVLSDGRPDDQDGYRGAYGVEDTRQAVLEARARGVHPYCVTIDEEAMEYLPHMFGRSGFTLVRDVRRLPQRISEIYRRITL